MLCCAPRLHPHKEKPDYDEGKKIEGKHNMEANKDKDIKGKESEEQQGRKESEFVEQRYKKWGGAGRYKEPTKVWNKVGIVTRNKFNLLETGHQNQEEDQ
ncbi:hypothetical protein KY289_036584 [Solanum tuberosum]|nr:hypothetical protein KY289_036584 [Solanum tuberosum]